MSSRIDELRALLSGGRRSITTIHDVRRTAEEFRAKVNIRREGNTGRIEVSAPIGYHWRDGGSASLVAEWDRRLPGDHASAKVEALSTLRARIARGLVVPNVTGGGK